MYANENTTTTEQIQITRQDKKMKFINKKQRNE